jgi:hypothetical protein
MNKILYSICIGTLALAVTAWGEEVQGRTRVQTKKARSAANVQRTGASGTVRSSAAMRTRASVSAERFHPRTNATVRERGMTNVRTGRVQARSDVAVNRQRSAAVARERNMAMSRRSNAAADRTATSARERNLATNRQRNSAFARERNMAFAQGRNNRNARVTNNWQGAGFSGRSYTVFRNYHQQWHDRGWWRSHFNRIVFVDGGWWYWNAGYWFPAWGYAPYAYYPYDGPIYGYNGLAPNQVIVDVQTQLQRDGYYAGPVDGVLGPMTRQAIASYQADNGLAITSAIDRPTLSSMGLA